MAKHYDCIKKPINELIQRLDQQRSSSRTRSLEDYAIRWNVSVDMIKSWRDGIGRPGAKGKVEILKAVLADAHNIAGFDRDWIENLLDCACKNNIADAQRQVILKEIFKDDGAKPSWFQTRDEELLWIDQWLNNQKVNVKPDILLITGEQGLGKSLILREAKRRATENGFKCALIEPHSAYNSNAALYQLFSQLTSPPIPLPMSATREVHKRILNLYFKAINESVASFALLEQLLEGVFDKDRKLSQNSLEPINADQLDKLYRAFDREALLLTEPRNALLPAIIEDLIASSKNGQKIGVFVDDYQAFVPEKFRNWLREQFVNSLQEEGVYIGVAGRHPLTLQEWHLPKVKPLFMQRLDEDRSRKICALRGISDSEEQNRLFIESEGIPLWLNQLIDNTFSKKTIRPIDTITTPTHDSNSLDGRLPVARNARSNIQALIEAKWQDLYDMAFVLREFQLERIAHALEQPASDLRDGFALLKSEQWVQHNPLGYSVHDLMRESALDEFRRDEPKRYRQFHAKAAKAYQQAEQTLENWKGFIYHLGCSDENAAIDFLRSQRDVSRSAELLDLAVTQLAFMLLQSDSERVRLWAELTLSDLDETPKWRTNYVRDLLPRTRRIQQDRSLQFYASLLNARRASFEDDLESESIFLNSLEKDLQNIPELTPFEKSQYWNRRANFHRRFGNLGQALSSAHQGYSLAPKSSSHFYFEIQFSNYFLIGQYDKAIEIIDSIEKLPGEYFKFYSLHYRAFTSTYTGASEVETSSLLKQAQEFIETWKSQRRSILLPMNRWFGFSKLRHALFWERLELAKLFLEQVDQLYRESSAFGLAYTEELIGHQGSLNLLYEKELDQSFVSLSEDLLRHKHLREAAITSSLIAGNAILTEENTIVIAQKSVEAIKIGLEHSWACGEIALNNTMKWVLRFAPTKAEKLVTEIHRIYLGMPQLAMKENMSYQRDAALHQQQTDKHSIDERIKEWLHQIRDGVAVEPPLRWTWY